MDKGRIEERDNDLVLSFKAVRQALGWLGIALPVVLLVGAMLFRQPVAASISHFYYSQMSDLFVGIMCAIGVFLISYKGYDRKPGEWLSDKWVSRAAGAAALGVALVPTHTPEPPLCSIFQCFTGIDRAAALHNLFAGAFFVTLALFSLVLFTKSDPTEAKTPEKRRRNAIFRTCGWVIVAAILALTGYSLSPAPARTALDAVSFQFWVESMGVWAFGISWLVKGELIGFLND